MASSSNGGYEPKEVDSDSTDSCSSNHIQQLDDYLDKKSPNNTQPSDDNCSVEEISVDVTPASIARKKDQQSYVHVAKFKTKEEALNFIKTKFNHCHCNSYEGVKSSRLYFKCTSHQRCSNKIVLEIPYGKSEFNVQEGTSPHSSSQKPSRGISDSMKQIITEIYNSGTRTPSAIMFLIQRDNSHDPSEVPSLAKLKSFLIQVRKNASK